MVDSRVEDGGGVSSPADLLVLVLPLLVLMAVAVAVAVDFWGGGIVLGVALLEGRQAPLSARVHLVEATNSASNGLWHGLAGRPGSARLPSTLAGLWRVWKAPVLAEPNGSRGRERRPSPPPSGSSAGKPAGRRAEQVTPEEPHPIVLAVLCGIGLWAATVGWLFWDFRREAADGGLRRRKWLAPVGVAGGGRASRVGMPPSRS